MVLLSSLYPILSLYLRLHHHLPARMEYHHWFCKGLGDGKGGKWGDICAYEADRMIVER